MVSKRQYGFYLTSYEEFYVFEKITIRYTCVILTKKWMRIYSCIFGTKNEKKGGKKRFLVVFSWHKNDIFSKKMVDIPQYF